jgi:hypothetical protein
LVGEYTSFAVRHIVTHSSAVEVRSELFFIISRFPRMTVDKTHQSLKQCQDLNNDIRSLIRNEVVTILTSGNSKEKTMPEAKAQQVAIYLEKLLYLGSSSYSEYSNLETLRFRLKKVVADRRQIGPADETDNFQFNKVPSFEKVQPEPYNPVFLSSPQGHLTSDCMPTSDMMSRRFHTVCRSCHL